MRDLLFGVGLFMIFLSGLIIGYHSYPTDTTTSKAWEEVEESKLGNSFQAMRLADAYRHMLKLYYHYKDYEEYDFINDTYEGRYTFWDDCISETDAYDTANEILQGDWGDFFDE